MRAVGKLVSVALIVASTPLLYACSKAEQPQPKPPVSLNEALLALERILWPRYSSAPGIGKPGDAKPMKRQDASGAARDRETDAEPTARGRRHRADGRGGIANAERASQETPRTKKVQRKLETAPQQYLKILPARYNIPDHLTYGESKAISFVLETQGVGTGADRLIGMAGKVVTTSAEVGPKVKALLTGPADLVEIKPRGGDEAIRKTVTQSEPVQWEWDVKAIGVGTAALKLTLISFIPNKEGDTRELLTFRREIPIEISMINRAKRVVAEINPLWTFLAAVVAALGGLFAFFGWRTPGRTISQQG
jgi:hypothetical protein